MKSPCLCEDEARDASATFSTSTYVQSYTLRSLGVDGAICINHKQWAISLSNKKY